MAYISSIVYHPPKQGFPFLAVVFDTEGEVLVARAVPTEDSGNALIASVLSEFAKQTGLHVKEELG